MNYNLAPDNPIKNEGTAMHTRKCFPGKGLTLGVAALVIYRENTGSLLTIY